jgi:hypothetical protein
MTHIQILFFLRLLIIAANVFLIVICIKGIKEINKWIKEDKEILDNYKKTGHF